MDLQLRGKTALVTGASKGIGAACARALAEEGCNLHLVARDGEALTALAEELRHMHGNAVEQHLLDLSLQSAMDDLAHYVGDVDIVVNNAGAIPPGNILDIDDKALRAAFDLKLFGYIALTRAYFARMYQRGGAIINVIGLAGERWDYGYFAGSTANAALMAFSRAVGGGSVDHNVRIVGINPGPIATDRMVVLLRARAETLLGNADRWEELIAGLPGKKLGMPQQVADLVSFLASPRASHISGTVVTIDGGLASR